MVMTCRAAGPVLIGCGDEAVRAHFLRVRLFGVREGNRPHFDAEGFREQQAKVPDPA